MTPRPGTRCAYCGKRRATTVTTRVRGWAPPEGGTVLEVSPDARVLARQVLLHEAAGRVEPEALAAAAERAYARLHERLAGLIGSTGYAILFARALRLAQAEVAALEGVTLDMEPPGCLLGAREFALAQTGDAAAAGFSAIFAHFFALLVTFIGEDLALRLVREAWPESTDDQVESEGRA